MLGYILDTNVFNKLVDGEIQKSDLPPNGKFFATHVQIDELNKTVDEDRRARLFLQFFESSAQIIKTESFIVGVSRLGQGKIGSATVYKKIRKELDLKKKRTSNIQDAMIAEVAILNELTLITFDLNLKTVAENNGCQTLIIEKNKVKSAQSNPLKLNKKFSLENFQKLKKGSIEVKELNIELDKIVASEMKKHLGTFMKKLRSSLRSLGHLIEIEASEPDNEFNAQEYEVIDKGKNRSSEDHKLRICIDTQLSSYWGYYDIDE